MKMEIDYLKFNNTHRTIHFHFLSQNYTIHSHHDETTEWFTAVQARPRSRKIHRNLQVFFFFTVEMSASHWNEFTL